MIQMQTKLNTQDNSGVKTIQCIKSFNGKTVKIGQLFLSSVKKMKTNTQKKTKIKKGQVLTALLTQTKYKTKTNTGYIHFDQNKAILIDKKNQPLGNRILGPIKGLMRKDKFLKVVSLATVILN